MKTILRWLGSCTVIASPLLLTACLELGVSYSDEDETIQVDYYRQQCDSDSPSLCYSVQRNSDDGFEISEYLNGFSGYEWGKRYSLEVETSFDDSGDPDNFRYKSTVGDEAITEAFSLTLHTDTGILASSDQLSWTLGGETTFTATADQGAAINNAVSSGQVLMLEFTAADNVLTLNTVQCSAADDDFASECEGTSNVDWTVAHYQSDCNLNTEHLCLIYRVNDSDDWELLLTDSSDIENFTPEWGKEYEVEVIQTVSNGGQLTSASLDQSSTPTSVDRIEVDNRFLFILNGRLLSDPDNNNQISLYDGGQRLNCDSVCNDIEDAIDSDNMMLLQGYVQNSEVFVERVWCDENPGASFNNCVEDYNDDQDDDDKVTWWPPLN